jgi:hypothetical protein
VKHRLLGALVLLGALAVTASFATSAVAAVVGSMEILDRDGNPEIRAGAHPDRLILKFGSDPDEEPREIHVEFPAGIAGASSATTLCRAGAIEQIFNMTCPSSSQVGSMPTATQISPLYSVEPAPGEAIRFAAPSLGSSSVMGSQLRPDDFGLTLRVGPIPQESSIFPVSRGGEVTLWGVPADHQEGTSLRQPLLTLPTRCDGPSLASRVLVRTWQHPERWQAGFADSGYRLTGCDELGFQPRLGFALDSPVADAPSGMTVDVSVPQDEDPDGRSTSQMSGMRILMPPGMAVSPGGAAQLRACSDAQLAAGTATAASCPASSRVGTLEIDAPAVGKATLGTIYLGEEHPGDRLRLFMVASAGGTELKLVGSMRSDPVTGRLAAVVEDMPQVSFARLRMSFDGGPKALLATPLECGPATAAATIAPYSGTAPVQASATVMVARPGQPRCEGPPPFAPSFTAVSASARAGAPTSLSTSMQRRDGEQLPGRFSVTLPAGLSAALGSVEPCPEAKVGTGTCPATSRVGSAYVEVGPGSEPAQLAGDVHLTGPYRRAPFGLAMSFDAVVGPFDLGRFGVRAALRLDPLSGQITIDTDALPQTVGGLPIRMQTIDLEIDRPGFIHNPTSCRPQQALTAVRSSAGALANASSDFDYSGCLALRFRPKLAMALTGRSQLHAEGKPGLRISVRTPGGANNANLRSASFALPQLLRFDSGALRELCARGAAARGNCPAGSRVGNGYARTALLEEPLRGSIYIVQPSDDGSPDLWTSLEGGGLQMNLRGETATAKDGRVEAKLIDLPDFPLSSFTMRLAAGRHGIFKLRRSPCAGDPSLAVRLALVGQNEIRLAGRDYLVTPGGCGNG